MASDQLLAAFLSFEGRVPRNHFWFTQALGFLLFLAATLFDERSTVGWFGVMFFTVMAVWILVAGQVRRFHDLGFSGYWVLLNFLPFAGSLFVLSFLGFFKGRPNANRFGPPSSTKSAS
jgi:uncharacterized membrane protein YhaH (DUF805 family)